MKALNQLEEMDSQRTESSPTLESETSLDPSEVFPSCSLSQVDSNLDESLIEEMDEAIDAEINR